MLPPADPALHGSFTRLVACGGADVHEGGEKSRAITFS